MIKINKQNKQHLVAFSIFSGILLFLLTYAGNTGWRLFSSDGNKQQWNSSGPGYHK